jgi:hypothetical protein
MFRPILIAATFFVTSCFAVELIDRAFTKREREAFAKHVRGQ